MSYRSFFENTAKDALKVITGGPQEPHKPTDLEIALARIHDDHTTAMVAIKLLTESVQSSASGNLNMVLAQQERQAVLVTKLNDIKRNVTSSDSRHYAAFQLALNPVTRAMDAMSDKIKELDASVHAMHMNIGKVKTELHMDREAQSRIQNSKLNAIAIRIDELTKLLARNLIKHPKDVTVAPPKKDNRGGKQPGGGRRKGVKDRPAEVRYAEISNKLQRCRAPKARAKFMATLVILRRKMGMAPLSDRALGKSLGGLIGKAAE